MALQIVYGKSEIIFVFRKVFSPLEALKSYLQLRPVVVGESPTFK